MSVALTPSGPRVPVLARRPAFALDGLWPPVLVALAIRVAVVLATPRWVPTADAFDFDRIAVDLAHHWVYGPSVFDVGTIQTAFRPPVLPFLISLLYRVVGTAPHSSWQWARLLEAVWGAAVVALVWAIAARLWDRRVAAVAAALTAVYPPLIMVGASLLSESIFIPVLLATVLCGLRAREAGERRPGGRGAILWAAGTGVLLAIATLSRSNGIVLGLPLLWLLWRGRPRLAVRAPLALLLAAAVTLAPWTIRNAVVFHTFVPTTTETGFALAGIYNPAIQGHAAWQGQWGPPGQQVRNLLTADPHLNQAELSDALTHDALHYLAAHPASVLYEAKWNGLRLLDLGGYRPEEVEGLLEGYPVRLIRVSMIAFWALGLVALAGIGVSLADRRRRGAAPAAEPRRYAGRAPAAFWWCPAILFLTLLPISGDTRYRSPIDPFLILLAAVALVRGAEALGRRRRRGGGDPAGPAAAPGSAGAS